MSKVQNISGIDTSSGKQRNTMSYYLVWWFFPPNCMYIFSEAIFPKDTYFQDCQFKEVIAPCFQLRFQ